MRVPGTTEANPVSEPNAPPEKPLPATGIRPGSFLSAYDLLLALLVLGLAFLLGSFAVRNSDFWQNLATGRLIAQGEYSFGSDPFCYTTAEQTWVNANWLYDFLLYLVYSASDGTAVVFVKSLGIAFLFALLLFLGRSGHSILLTGSVVVIGLLAIAPFLTLRPVLFSYFFSALFVFLLIKGESIPALAKRLPLVMGLLTVLWANIDGHACLAPLMLGAYCLGKVLGFSGSHAPSQLTSKIVLQATLFSFVGTLISPNHIRLWLQVPELVGLANTQILAGDRELSRSVRGLIDASVFDFSGKFGGNPINVYAIVLMFGLGILSWIYNFKTHLGGLLLLQAPLFVLSLFQVRIAPIWWITWIAWTAWNLGEGWLRRLEAKAAAGIAPPKKAGQIVSRLGFTLTLIVLLIAAWPGWLNSFPWSDQNARRVAWEIDVDASLQRLGERVEALRQSGALPADARGILIHPEAAAYLQWFAPSEKLYIDNRFSLHQPRIESWLKLRQVFDIQNLLDQKKIDFDVAAFLQQEKISYLIIASANAYDNQELTSRLLAPIDRAEPTWDLWEVAGRTTLLGFRPSTQITEAQAAKLRFDPVARTFGADARKVNEPEELRPIDQFNDPLIQFADRYFNVVPRAGAPIEEARMLLTVQDAYVNRSVAAAARGTIARALFAGAAPTLYFTPQVSFSKENVAMAVLAVREARQAILATPQLPEGYLNLARAMTSEALPWANDLKNEAVAVQLQRALVRAAPGRALQRLSGVSRLQMFNGAVDLINLHLQEGRLDLADEARMQAREMLPELTMMEEQFREKLAKGLDQFRPGDNLLAGTSNTPKGEKQNPTIEELLTKRITSYENNSNNKDPLTRSQIARRFGLTREALKEIQSIDLRNEKIPPQVKVQVIFEEIDLLKITGQLERAIELQKQLQDNLPPELKASQEFMQQQVLLRTRLATLSGQWDLALEGQGELLQAVQSDYRDLTRETPATAKLNQLPNDQLYSITNPLRTIFAPHAHGLEQFVHIAAEPAAFSLLNSQRQALTSLGTLQFRSGLLHLERGENEKAKQFFEAAVKPGELPINFAERNMVEVYLNTLDGKR